MRASACRSAEPGDDLARVHARLDDLEGDLALHGLGLLGHEDCAHAAFAELLQELVRADDGPGTLGDGLVNRRKFRASRWPVSAEPIVSGEQGF
jgi:hypothetical protein